MITPQKVFGRGQPRLTGPQQSCLVPLPFFADPALHSLVLSPTISEALHPRELSPAPLARCWYIQHWFWLWQRKDDCFEFSRRNRVIVIYQSFVTFDDCGSWGGSFAAVLVSLCENPVFGRMPFPSTKASNLPRREDGLLVNGAVHPQAQAPWDQFPQRQNSFLRVTKPFHKFHGLLR